MFSSSTRVMSMMHFARCLARRRQHVNGVYLRILSHGLPIWNHTATAAAGADPACLQSNRAADDIFSMLQYGKVLQPPLRFAVTRQSLCTGGVTLFFRLS